MAAISTAHFQISLQEQNQFVHGREVSGSNNKPNEKPAVGKILKCSSGLIASYFMESSARIKKKNPAGQFVSGTSLNIWLHTHSMCIENDAFLSQVSQYFRCDCQQELLI